MPGGTRLDFDRIRPTTLRPFGLMWRGPTRGRPGRRAAVRVLAARRRPGPGRTSRASSAAPGPAGVRGPRAADDREPAWRTHASARSPVDTPSTDQQTVFATALYHSLIKPCFAAGREPVLADGRTVRFDICTMWDIYRTQLPLITALFPDRAVELANALLYDLRGGGQPPDRLPDGQGCRPVLPAGQRAGAHLPGRPVPARRCRAVDWDWALCHMDTDLRRTYGEEYLLRGVAHPITHTLDLAFGYQCTAQVARYVGDNALAEQFERARHPVGERVRPGNRAAASTRPTTRAGGGTTRSGCCTTCGPGSSWPGATRRSSRMLDAFFGYGADPIKQVGERPSVEELAAGYALNRFEGLNNEPDMEAPWAYHYVGRPDRTAEVVHAAVHNLFGLGRGGLPGNDDSGGSAPGTSGPPSGCSPSPARASS